MTKKGEADRGDAAQDVLDHLLSNKTNVKRLRDGYQKQFEEDPIGVVERLLKLIPKSARKTPDNRTPKAGVNLIVTGETPTKRKRKSKT